MSLKVTAKMLRKIYACPTQVRRFKREWPDGARLSFKTFLRAVELGLCVSWFLVRVLRRDALRAFMVAQSRARDKRDTAWHASCLRRVDQSIPGKKCEARRIERAADERAERRCMYDRARAAAHACKTGMRKRSCFMEAVL